MGYYASSESANFTIHHEHLNCLVNKLHIKNYIEDNEASSDNIDLILDVLSHNGLTGEVGHDKNGNPYIESVYYEYQKYYDDDMTEFLSIIAEFVEAGSYIGFAGEDGSFWAFYFDGSSDIQEFYGHVVYEGMPVKDGKEKEG